MTNLFKRVLFLMLIGLPQIGSPQVSNVTEVDSWKLLPQAEVTSSGIFLDQIVTVSGANRVIPHIRLAHAPSLGQAASFSRGEALALAQAGIVGLQTTNWGGAAQIRISRRVRPLEDSDLLDLLTATLQKEYVKNQGTLELRLTRAWANPLVPDEPLTLKLVEMPTVGVLPSFVVTFELWNGKERVGNWQAPVRASVWREIPMAQSNLLRGQALKDADVTMERSDVLIQRDAFLNFPTTDESLELTENISMGRPVLNRSVRTRPLILRGQIVEGIFQDGALGISLMVETLEDGARGQTVRVRNPKTKRELYGKVENEKTIRITL
jgi:flagella basal body P-ring formation protein FlgA